MPGDSPVGLRLPMNSLQWIPPEDYPYTVEQDPMEPREDLPTFEAGVPPAEPVTQPPVFDDGAQMDGAPRQFIQEQHAGGKGGVRTALSIEIRDGVLCAFMPPVEKLEDYLELIAVVEATAET